MSKLIFTKCTALGALLLSAGLAGAGCVVGEEVGEEVDEPEMEESFTEGEAGEEEAVTPLIAIGNQGKSCDRQLNAFNADYVGTRYVPAARDNGQPIKLNYGRLSGYGWVAWAKNSGRGHRVWLDWSDQPGSWYQCGPFTVDGSQGPEGNDRFTYAINQYRNRYFRACGDLGAGRGGHACTDWFHADGSR